MTLKIARSATLALVAASTIVLGACSATPKPDQPELAGSSASLTPEAYDARLSGVPYPFPVKSYRFQAQQQTLEMAYMDIQPEHPNGHAVDRKSVV